MRELDLKPRSQPFPRRISPASLLVRGVVAFAFLVGSVVFVQFAWTSAKAAWDEIEPNPAIMAPQPQIPAPAKPEIEMQDHDRV